MAPTALTLPQKLACPVVSAAATEAVIVPVAAMLPSWALPVATCSVMLEPPSNAPCGPVAAPRP